MSRIRTQDTSPLSAITEFMKLESASGILLVVAGVLALVAANTALVIWVNDLLMAIFFLLVGLEIKREVTMGELSDRAKVALPAIAAVGGMLSLFGDRVPVGLKIFLMTLAVLDDLGAIVVIALFYTSDLSVTALTLAAIAVAALAAMNRTGVMRIAPYVLVGSALWACVLKSGVHATLAGVVTAFVVPVHDPAHPDHPPLRTLEHALHPWVAFAILCGIGFTMSLFIGMLAFENAASGEVIVIDRLGVLAGSLLSAVAGWLVLNLVLPRNQAEKR